MTEDRKRLFKVFMSLPQPTDKVQCQYVWIDGSLRNLRTKSITWPREPQIVEELPVMEFCGSATYFDVGDKADYYCHPVKIYKDPFRLGNNRLVFCETRTREGLPTFANNRHRLRMLKDKAITEVSELSFYQPYTILRSDGRPLAYKEDAYSPESKSGFVSGREVAESHYRVCLYSGIEINSLEPLSNQGQWKYAMGPCSYVNLGDEVWMSRFLLMKVAEDFGVTISFDPSYQGNSLRPLSADIQFRTDHLIKTSRQRIIDDLFAKFGIKDKPLKIVTPPDKIILKSIVSDIDPYSIFIRLLETVLH